MDWDNVKKQIKNEFGEHFDGVDTDHLVDMLKKVFEVKIENEYELNGLANSYSNALNNILDDDSTKNDKEIALVVLKGFEPFLKKILYYIDREHFLHIFKNEGMGIAVIKALELNPDNIYLDEAHLKTSDLSENDFEYYLIKTYLLRNKLSHNAPSWTSLELATAINYTLIFYLEIINKFQVELEQKIPETENDFSKYIENKIKEFKEWKTRFIPTNVEENSSFSLYEGIVTEDKSSYEYNDDSESDSDDESEDDIIDDGYDNSNPGKSGKERSGTVDQIRRKENLPERCMMLWGDAGLGKSTTLQYLTYIDAQAYKDGKSNKIPVYIPLGNLIQETDTIENAILSELDVGVQEERNLLKKGLLNIFLDGVNELSMSMNIRSDREKEIQVLLDSQRKLDASKRSLIIISNRPEGNSSFTNIPIFNLKSLSHDQLLDFIKKNVKDENIFNIINNGITRNQKFEDIIKTPLKAMKLISIVTDKGTFPETEYDLIGEYLKRLYERERTEKHNINFEVIDRVHYLLTYLAAHGKIKNSSNSGLERDEVIDCFDYCIEKKHYNIDSEYILDILIKMGVLSCNSKGDVICFSHESYQDYYAQKAIKKGLFQQDELFSIEEYSKKTSINKDYELLDVHVIVFYEKYANNPGFFKTIQYDVEATSENNTKTFKLKLLSEYNIKLAAEIISKDPKCDKAIENYILQRSDSSLSSILESNNVPSKEFQKQVIDSLWVDYYLQNPEYIEKHIIQLMAVDNDERLSIISFVTSLDDTDYIIRIIKIIDNSTKDIDLKNFYLFKMSDVFYLRNLKFIRTEDDKDFIKKLSETYLKNAKNFAERYKFILAFNIPKIIYNKEEIFNSIESEDIGSIIKVLNSINNEKQIRDFLQTVLNVKNNSDKLKLYSRIIKAIYSKHVIFNDEALTKKILYEINHLDISAINIFKFCIAFNVKAEDIDKEKLNYVKNCLSQSIIFRLYHEKECELFLNKYLKSYSLPHINIRIKEILIGMEPNLRTINSIIHVFEYYLSNNDIENIIDLLKVILETPVSDFKKELYSEIIECIYSSRIIIDCNQELLGRLFLEYNQLNLSIIYILKFILSFNIQNEDIPKETLVEINKYFSNIQFRLSNEHICNLFFGKYYDICSLPSIKVIVQDNIKLNENTNIIIQSLNDYLSNHEIENLTYMLEIILSISIENDDFKKKLYSEIIYFMYYRKSAINGLSKDKRYLLLEKIQTFVLEVPDVLIVKRIHVSINKTDAYRNHYFNYLTWKPLSNTTNLELQSLIDKLIIAIDFKLTPYDFASINEIISKYGENASIILNTLSYIIELFFENKDIAGLLYLCKNQPCCLSLLFFYLPFKIRYFLARKSGYYYSNAFDYNRRRIAKPRIKYWEPYADKTIQLYEQDIIPLAGIKERRDLNFFFSFEFRKFKKFVPHKVFNFNTFFIKLSDEIKIQLLEYRETFFPQVNIFLHLTDQFNKCKKIDDNIIQIPLDEEETLFLECEKNNDPNNPKQIWNAISIIEKETDAGDTP